MVPQQLRASPAGSSWSWTHLCPGVSPPPAGSPLLQLRHAPAEHNKPDLVSSLDSALSLWPSRGAHHSRHSSRLVLDHGLKAITRGAALWFELALLSRQFGAAAQLARVELIAP